MSGEEVLTFLIDLLVTYLEDLYSLKESRQYHFIEGEKTAYVECLEIIQRWDLAGERGLNWNIEERFPL